MVETDQTSVGPVRVFHPYTANLSAISSIKFRSIILDAIFWATFIHTEGVKSEAQSTTFKGSSRHRSQQGNVDVPCNIWHNEQTVPLSCHGYSLEWLWSGRRSNMSSTLRIWLSINLTGSCKTTFKLQAEWQCYLQRYYLWPVKGWLHFPFENTQIHYRPNVLISPFKEKLFSFAERKE